MKTVLVTGAGRGIGQEIVRQLLQHTDFRVLAAMRRPEPWPAKVDPGRLTVLALDVSEPESIALLADDLLAKRTELDAIVHNAGIYGSQNSPGSPRQIMLTNYYGPQRLTMALVPILRPRARIVCISSGMGELSGFSSAAAKDMLTEMTVADIDARVERYLQGEEPGWPTNPYSASKGALNALVRCWHRAYPEWTSVAICPGWVRTDMGGQGAPRSVEKGAETPVWALTVKDLVGGCFYRDREKIPW